jgi:hypothetical protein
VLQKIAVYVTGNACILIDTLSVILKLCIAVF